MKEKSILPLTKQEADVLVQLLDIAVKSRGLEVAESALVLAKRIQQAFVEQPTLSADAKPSTI